MAFFVFFSLSVRVWYGPLHGCLHNLFTFTLSTFQPGEISDSLNCLVFFCIHGEPNNFLYAWHLFSIQYRNPVVLFPGRRRFVCWILSLCLKHWGLINSKNNKKFQFRDGRRNEASTNLWAARHTTSLCTTVFQVRMVKLLAWCEYSFLSVIWFYRNSAQHIWRLSAILC